MGALFLTATRQFDTLGTDDPLYSLYTLYVACMLRPAPASDSVPDRYGLCRLVFYIIVSGTSNVHKEGIGNVAQLTKGSPRPSVRL